MLGVELSECREGSDGACDRPTLGRGEKLEETARVATALIERAVRPTTGGQWPDTLVGDGADTSFSVREGHPV